MRVDLAQVERCNVQVRVSLHKSISLNALRFEVVDPG